MKTTRYWVQELQHGVFRVLSLVFSLISAHAIYWFFSALNGVDALQGFVTTGTSVGFACLGYFVTRGFAHRLMKKQKVLSYLVIGLLYELVEVVCNYGEAAARYPDMQWIMHLPHWQFSLFSVVAPLVLSIIPLFNMALAYIDMDLMLEKESVPAAAPQAMKVPVPGGQGQRMHAPAASSSMGPGRGPVAGNGLQPKHPAPTSVKGAATLAGQTTMPQLQTSYPPMPAPAMATRAATPLAGAYNGMRMVPVGADDDL